MGYSSMSRFCCRGILVTPELSQNNYSSSDSLVRLDGVSSFYVELRLLLVGGGANVLSFKSSVRRRRKLQTWSKRTAGWKLRGLGHLSAFSTISDKYVSTLQGSPAPSLTAQLLLLGLYFVSLFFFPFKLSHQATPHLCSSF